MKKDYNRGSDRGNKLSDRRWDVKFKGKAKQRDPDVVAREKRAAFLREQERRRNLPTSDKKP